MSTTTESAASKRLAFHGDTKIKAKYLARLRAHKKADELVKGIYWQDGKGCAVGCTIHSSEHQAYEDELGIPVHIAYLEDSIFEALPNGQAKKWPIEFLSAIPVGADLSLVWPKFALWLLTDKKHGVLQKAKAEEVKQAILGVSGLYERLLKGEAITDKEWAGAAGAARAAGAAWAAWAAEAAEAAWAAWAAEAAEAAWAAEAAGAAEAAWAAEAEHQAKQLLKLLREA